MGDTMVSSKGFAWFWGTALVCLAFCGYWMWKKNPNVPSFWGPEAVTGQRASTATINEEANNGYVAQETPAASNAPAKMV
ncbi:Aste57867_1040 [Aphanomyces stellatus]|uniref:Aste57867_1040 protein n=1 Tax=Aphanomyces stellatus TaxID=120398 RepID=A0A485K4N1_9STRA|nr:hypothetical protein As57867_001039 [Aphanomyces stellatus]VFT78262.1 Aste57867_1040 [Aphanomyces stellatus]